MNGAVRLPPFPFLVPGILALIFGLVAGLFRLPWALPFGASVSLIHGPLMVSGFLGTVIAVERAAALQRGWAWSAPALNGFGVIALLGMSQIRPGLPFDAAQAGALLFVAGGIGLVAIFGEVIRRQRALFNVVMGLGALAYLGANLVLLAGKPIASAVPLWSAFLVLTIAGERLELNRFLRPRPAMRAAFVGLLGLVVLGGWATLVSSVWADRLLGVGFVLLGTWLLGNDIARRTIRMTGVTRFTAVCLLVGYVWLVVAGLSLLVHPGRIAGTEYDAALHALYVGFVLSMIFGHAPIIVPALLGRRVAFHAFFYVPLLLLHASLLLRIGGDHLGWLAGRRWGGLVNEIALVLYLVVLVVAVRRGSRGPASSGPARDS